MKKNESRCMACGAPVLWVVTEKKRKRMPVDAVPTPEGNLQIVADLAYVVPKKKLAVLSDYERKGLRTSHFATCPFAERFKGKKGTRAKSGAPAVEIVESDAAFNWPAELEPSAEVSE